MSFPTNWDVSKYKTNYESDEHWELRRKFIETHKERFPEDKLICLAQVFFNIEFLGCRYPEKTMRLVEELSQGVADEHREKQKGKLKRSFVEASDAAGDKIKRKSQGFSEPPKKAARHNLNSCFVHAEFAVPKSGTEQFPGFILYENCRPNGVMETCPLNILTHSTQKNQVWKNLTFDFANTTTSANEYQIQCDIKINNKLLASATGSSNKEAKTNAAIEGLKILRKSCYTIQAKHPFFSDNPEVSKEGKQSDTEKPIAQDNVGSRMMQKMGWTGSGLGKQQQGIQAPIQASSQVVQRSGFGRANGRELENKFKQVFKDFIGSSSDYDLVFTPDFSSDERKTLHRLAQTMQLKTRSYGKNEDRRLVVFKALSLPMLMESLVACSGSNAKYTLVPPTPDDGDTGQCEILTESIQSIPVDTVQEETKLAISQDISQNPDTTSSSQFQYGGEKSVSYTISESSTQNYERYLQRPSTKHAQNVAEQNLTPGQYSSKNKCDSAKYSQENNHNKNAFNSEIEEEDKDGNEEDDSQDPSNDLDDDDYLDQLILSMQDDLKNNIEQYNLLVRQIHQQGAFTTKERRRYSHLRNQVKERCGLLKPDITRLPNLNFQLQDYLIDPASALEFKNDPSNPINSYKSGHPNAAALPNLLGKGGKGKKRFRQMKKRPKTADHHNKVQKNLKTVTSDANYRQVLFRELAQRHRAAKARGDLKGARKIKRKIMLKLRAL